MRANHLLSAALCLIMGCASTPKITYYTFAMEPSGAVNPVVNLDVDLVRTSDALNRSQIMVLSSPTRVEYYATDQWVGGLGELVKQKLEVEFGDHETDRRTVVLSVKVLNCEQVDTPGGAKARMRLFVAFRDPEAKRYREPLLERVYESSRSAERASAAAVVEALTLCAEDLARSIADDAAAL
jgi:uncharacterized lipoprotein YmbA